MQELLICLFFGCLMIAHWYMVVMAMSSLYDDKKDDKKRRQIDINAGVLVNADTH